MAGSTTEEVKRSILLLSKRWGEAQVTERKASAHYRKRKESYPQLEVRIFLPFLHLIQGVLPHNRFFFFFFSKL